jgi:hypothetical protein
LHIGKTLPADRCHLNDTAVLINRHHRGERPSTRGVESRQCFVE